MLAVSHSPLTTTNAKDGCRHQADMDQFLSSTTATSKPPPFSVGADVDFPDFDSIDFDDLFGGDALPYLEMEPADLLGDFSVCPSSAWEEDSSAASADYAANQVVPSCYHGESEKKDGKGSGLEGSGKEEEIQSNKSSASSSKESDNKGIKKMSSSNRSNKSNEAKRKTKVDWTPDLHRRFVQAVEQLGVDKAVPSRILELMGIDCLTRHNVASHLQKYRSHRKHLLAREAEAANWTQKRQMYGIAVAPPPPAPPNGGSIKGNTNHPWNAPIMGFPPPTPPPIHHPHHAFRPLHVWGHPTHHVEHQPPMQIWPKQLIPPPSPLQPPPHPWVAPLPAHPPPPSADPSLWHHQCVPNVVTPLTPCFPHLLPTMRFAVAPPVPGIPPTNAAMYRPDQHNVGAPAVTLQSRLSHPDPMELHPTKESIDAAIGDVLSKPWLPLPIGLKPPSTDSVMGELQRQGVPAIPPSCA